MEKEATFLSHNEMLELLMKRKLDCSLFLRKYIEFEKRKKKTFSIRQWSVKMGLASHSRLSQVLNKRAKLPFSYVSKMTRSMNLSILEAKVLELLVCIEHAKNTDELERFRHHLLEVIKKESDTSKNIWSEEESLIKNPLHMLIYEMTSLSDFKADARWIQKKCKINFSQEEIISTFNRLMTLGLLTVNSDGKICKAGGNLTTTNDKRDLHVQDYHSKVAQWASQEVFKQDLAQREFQSYVINISDEKIVEAKKMIRNFIQDLALKVEAAEGESQHSYQFNVHLFQLTKG